MDILDLGMPLDTGTIFQAVTLRHLRLHQGIHQKKGSCLKAHPMGNESKDFPYVLSHLSIKDIYIVIYSLKMYVKLIWSDLIRLDLIQSNVKESTYWNVI